LVSNRRFTIIIIMAIPIGILASSIYKGPICSLAVIGVEFYPDNTAPSNVTGLATSNITGTSLRLTWNAATDNIGVTGYKIYNSAGTLLWDVGNVLLRDVTGLSQYTQQSYKVKAYDAAGNHSAAFSNTVTPTTLDATNPTDVSGTPTVTNLASTSLTLDWNASTDDHSGIAGYKIYNSAGTLLYTTTGTATSYNITGLTASTAYTLKVKAYDNSGNISTNFSGTANVTTTAASLSPPGPFTVSYPDGWSKKWSWSPVSGAVNYRTYSAITAIGAAQPSLGSFTLQYTSTLTSFQSNGYESDQRFWYFVRTWNGSIESGNSEIVYHDDYY